MANGSSVNTKKPVGRFDQHDIQYRFVRLRDSIRRVAAQPIISNCVKNLIGNRLGDFIQDRFKVKSSNRHSVFRPNMQLIKGSTVAATIFQALNQRCDLLIAVVAASGADRCRRRTNENACGRLSVFIVFCGHKTGPRKRQSPAVIGHRFFDGFFGTDCTTQHGKGWTGHFDASRDLDCF